MDNDIRRPAARAARTYERRVLSYQEAASIRPLTPVTVSETALLANQPEIMALLAQPKQGVTIRLRLQRPSFLRTRRIINNFKVLRRPLRDWRIRATLVLIALIIGVTQVIPILEQHLTQHTYAMGAGEGLLTPKDSDLAAKLKFDGKSSSYNYNEDFNVTGAGTSSNSGGPQIKAVINQDPSQGISVTDPINNVSFTMKPQFRVLPGQQDANRVIYPFLDGTGWVVYTMLASSVKEDIILDHANGDIMNLKYDLELSDQGLEARLNADGSLGVYGTSLPIAGNVSTGSDKDAALLQKAREKAKKDKLMFSLPAPIVYESGHEISKTVHTKYQLKDNVLTTITAGLKNPATTFPLDVDPAVTVIGTSDLFRDTNADSNIDLDATSGKITRGKVTGGVVTAPWTTNTNNLVTGRFLHGAAVYDDYAYVAGGAAAGSTSNLTTVEYASISKSSQATGTWATTTPLPAALSRLQLVVYNGYMYAIGGSVTDTTCTTVSNKVYYNRIQSNGQLSANWITSANNLPSGVCGLGASIVNNRIYVAGGRTGAATSTGVNTVAYASINPDGSTTAFTSDDSTLPAVRYDADLEVYNTRLYIVGGSLAGTPTATVLVADLANDGTVYGTAGTASWSSTSPMVTARSNMGASLAAANDGYLYVQGGCTTFNGTQSCTAQQSDIEVAQINADGTLGSWANIATTVATYSQVGGSLQFWRGTIYVLGGCSAMNTGSVQCTTASNNVRYNTIASAGQIGPIKNGTVLPVALWGHSSAVVQGYLFVLGGCITNSCQSGTNDLTAVVRSAKLAADGTVGTWATTTSLPVALSATAIAVYNNYIYIMGGYAYTAQTNGSAVNTVYYGLVSNTGTIASWTTSANTYVSAANARYYSSAVVYHGVLYVFGGCVATANNTGCSTYYSTTFKSTIGTNGAPGTWTAGGNTLPNTTTGAQAAMGVALYNGYVYLTGGAGQNAGGQTNKIQYSKLSTAAGGGVGAFAVATGVMPHTLRRMDAYAMNGYLYIIGGHDGSTNTTYDTVSIGKINLSTGNIDSNLTDSIVKITERWDVRAAFSNGYIYVTGGCGAGNPAANCTSVTTKNEYFELYNASSKGTSAWAATGDGTTRNAYAGGVAYNGYLYTAGGCSSIPVAALTCTDAASTKADIYYASINPDGTLGSWTAGGSLGAATYKTCLVGVGGTLYAIGGADNANAATANVYYSAVSASTGAPNTGTWASTTALTAARAAPSCGTFNGRIYVTGGASGGTAQNTVYYSSDLTNGGTVSSWTTGTAFTTARYGHSTVIAGGYLYVIGGTTNDSSTANNISDVQYIQLNPSTGALTGSWNYTGDLANPLSYMTAYAANGYIYISGGQQSNVPGCSWQSWVAAINSSGTLSNWSLSANNAVNNGYGAAGGYYKGYIYNVGNACNGTRTATQFTGVQSQAMAATFSKYADLNGNGDPQKLVIYLTNAQLNAVDIEKWSMTYVSSREAANSWGQATVINPLLTQNAYNVNAYDGSGVDQTVSRWFYLSFSIDMSQSFTFTDDTQPNISQYGLHYSPPPSKRLLHGRDFRDQTQQGLDLKL